PFLSPAPEATGSAVVARPLTRCGPCSLPLPSCRPGRIAPPAPLIGSTRAAQAARPRRRPTIPRAVRRARVIPAAPPPDDYTAATDCEPNPPTRASHYATVDPPYPLSDAPGRRLAR